MSLLTSAAIGFIAIWSAMGLIVLSGVASHRWAPQLFTIRMEGFAVGCFLGAATVTGVGLFLAERYVK